MIKSKMPVSERIAKRKDQHIQICLTEDITYTKSAGFEDIEFLHNALPELNFEKIDTSITFLGKKLSFPFFIDAMTGGSEKTGAINKHLAQVAEEHKIAFALGSIRALIENPHLKETFYVRKQAPEVPLIANIGAAQLTQIPSKKIISTVESLEADAIQIHLNPLQEVLQPEGDKNFEGIEEAIRSFCLDSPFPVIAKETGSGISREVAFRLKKCGVTMINVSGAGGTSWAKVEYKRGAVIPGFGEWGIPTAVSTLACSKILPTISSGGIRSGVDIAKALALGAKCASSALPVLRSKNPTSLIGLYHLQLQTVMFLTGSKTISDLSKTKLIIGGRTGYLARTLNLLR
ncbi:MAG: type 2 isopentenyl-diphosphate Delta-isomerase [Candidatus Anstonellales archaeon]